MASVNRAVRFIFRQKPNLSISAGKTFHCSLILQQGHHDLAVMGCGLLMHYHQVPGQNAGVQHRLAPDSQGKILSVPPLGVKGNIIVYMLLGQNRRAGGHIPQHRHTTGRSLWLPGCCSYSSRTFPLRQCQGAALAAALCDVAQLLQVLNMKMNR